MATGAASANAASSQASGQARPDGGVGTAAGAGKKVRASGWILSIVAVVALGSTIAWFFYGRSALSFNSRDSVLVADFNNQTGDARFDQALEDAFVVDLQQSKRVNIFPQARTESVLEMMGKPAGQTVTAGIGREQMGNPDSREAGMRSLALLDMYRGRYSDAAKRFHECLLILSEKADFSTARVHLWLGIVAGGEGDKRVEEQQFDLAAQNLKEIGPKVVFGAILGQSYARAGFIDKAENLESTIAPLADAKNEDELGYLHLLQGEIAVAQKRYDDGINLLTLSNRENPTQLSSEALAHAYQQAGRINSAIPAYEAFVSDSHSVLWEPQQRWLAAHVTLTED